MRNAGQVGNCKFCALSDDYETDFNVFLQMSKMMLVPLNHGALEFSKKCHLKA